MSCAHNQRPPAKDSAGAGTAANPSSAVTEALACWLGGAESSEKKDEEEGRAKLEQGWAPKSNLCSKPNLLASTLGPRSSSTSLPTAFVIY